MKGCCTYRPDELHLDARVLEPLVVFRPYRDRPFDRLSIRVERCLLDPVLVELHVDRGPIVGVLEDDVDVHGSGEEVGHCGRMGFERNGRQEV